MIKINSAALASLGALLAFLLLQKEAVVRINIIRRGDRLCVEDINGLFEREIPVIWIGDRYRTIGRTESAPGAFCVVHITWIQLHLHTKITDSTRDLLNLSVGNDLNIGRPTGLYQLGGQDSY